MPNAIYFRQKAEQCRRLSKSLMSTDSAAISLNALAVEFDAQGAALEAEAKAALTMGFGDDIGDSEKPPATENREGD